jgi:hypothetical protein
VNNQQVAAVLAKIQLGDNRETDAAGLVLAEWVDSIGDLDFDDAVEAVRMHRRETTDYLTPAHVRTNVKRVRAARTPSNDTTPDRFKQLEAGVIPSAPKPANWDAMCAAWNDRAAFAREVAIYDAQLTAAGFAPTEARWAA